MIAPVEITPSTQLQTSTSQTDGMIRMGAIVDKASVSASGKGVTSPCVLDIFPVGLLNVES